MVFASRVFFLGDGYGVDADAWAVALVAERIAETGTYEASRLPGYPLQELVCSLFWKGGPWALNGLTALCSAVAAGIFTLILRRLGSRDAMLAGLALASAPALYINSTCSLDYLWALAFEIASLYFILWGPPIAAGVSLGLAIGCRITSAVMLLPLLLILAGRSGFRSGLADMARVTSTAFAVGLLLFLPVLWTYGTGFLQHYEIEATPKFYVFWNLTEKVWGILGMVGMAAALLSIPVRRGQFGERSLPALQNRNLAAASYVAIGLFVAGFLWLPHEPGYLIPIIPFVILLLAHHCKRKVFLGFCIALLLSPHVFSLSHPHPTQGPQYSELSIPFTFRGRSFRLDALQGPIWVERSQRLRRMEFAERILDASRTLPDGSIVFCGKWWPLVAKLKHGDYPEHVRHSHFCDRSNLDQFREEGIQVYYVPGTEAVNFKMHGLDLKTSGATPLFPAQSALPSKSSGEAG